ncbi:MAG: hypothetical protein KF703_16185, partial [Actinobacteria bacterium]|nr:hypothetical protein [Actinomycetota bacterium]
MSAAAADPDALTRYAGVVATSAPDLAGAGRWLAQAAAEDAERGAAATELAARIDRLALDEAATGRWVAAVGRAFADADRVAALAAVDLLGALAAHPVGSGVGRAALRSFLAGSPSAALVRAAGVALGPDGLADLARSSPASIGPIDGMPVAARLVANRELVRRALAASTDPVRRRALAALLADDPRTGRPGRILLFDPAGD